MKPVVVALPLVALLAMGFAGSAQAWVLPDASRAEAPLTSIEAEPHDPWHHTACVGLSTGTAHPACGTATGGPSGGLF